MKFRFTHLASMAAAGLLVVSCATEKTKEVMETGNSLTDQEKAAGLFTPEVMYKMGRIGSYALSPDGSTVALTVTHYSVEDNKGNTSLYVMGDGEQSRRQITDAAGNDSDPAWSADGKSIWFMSDRSGDTQLWRMPAEGGAMTQVSDIEGGIEGFGVSPKEDKAFYVKKVQVKATQSADVYPDMDKSKALVYDDLMARHWNYWDRGDYAHIFVADIRSGKLSAGVDIMPDEPWDAPMAPYFDNAEIAWNNAGTQLAYTCKKQTGTEYALTTDSDVYIYDLASAATENITEGMPGYDKYPAFSPDDTRVAFLSMERPGYEADKDRLMVHELATGKKTYLTQSFDHSAENVVWESNESLLFVAGIRATMQLCRVGMDADVQTLTLGDHDVKGFSLAAGRVVGSVTTLSMANELFDIDPATGAMTQITGVNAEIYGNIRMGEVHKRFVTASDGQQILTWVVLPPDFDPAKKYPTLLYCQGGPQNLLSQGWSYRWNYQLMAAQGYIVVAPNRRGVPSFGQAWTDQISGDYSGQNMRDYLSAIDELSREPWVDETRLGCVGASYGGYSAFYLAGNHDKRFKGFIAHCGIFNLESMYGTTEELFFPDTDYGGPYWSNNPIAKRTYENSPHKFVARWDTPILIITGLNDFRVPYAQSLEAFTAARVRGIPSRLVAFENEAHQVFKPQNALVWNREFFSWLDKYVKNTNPK